ncbi:polyadenylate-binding protein [Nematocida ausubeli]|nr:polyadenylate-binding protein [Nematocida ausubeli]
MNIEETQKEKKEGQIGRQNSIYVGDIPTSTTESDLFQIFSKVGQIYTVIIPRKELSIVKDKCYAYVTFFDEASVPTAIETFNFYELNGSQIRVMPLDKESVVNNREGNIVIKNLPKETDNQTLYDTFIIFGPIVSCKVVKNSLSECSGIGYIQYKDPKIAEVAIQMINKIMLNGKKLCAVQCVPNDKREKKRENVEKIFTNIYMKNFPKGVEEEELKKKLEEYGELTSFFVPRTETGEMRGFAFANYKTHEMAEAAILGLHDKPFFGGNSGEGENLYVQRAKLKSERVEETAGYFANPPEQEVRRNIYITNLPGDLNEEDVVKYFSKYGPINTYKLGTDTKNNRSYGYVFYQKAEDAAKAVELANKSEYCGQPLGVAFFKCKKLRELGKVTNNIYSSAGGNSSYDMSGAKGKKKMHTPASAKEGSCTAGYELYTLILSLAPNYTEKIAQAGFANEEEFAKKITGMILELDAEEVKRAAVLGNVLSNYVEESLEEIIMHRRKDESAEKKAVAIE